MLDRKLAQTPYTIQANHPLLLDDCETVWMIISGCLSIFATKVAQQQPEGSRRYLFSASGGEVVFGVAIGQQLGLLAVALEDTVLEKLSLEDFAAQITQGELEALAGLKNWLHRLGEAFPATFNVNTASAALPSESSALALKKHQILQPSSSDITWLQIDQGSMCWLGVKDLTLDSTSPWFPFARGLWLQAESAVEVRAISTPQWENSRQFLASLAFFQQYFCCYLILREAEEKEAQFRRFLAREQLNRQVSELALSQLTSVLQPEEEPASFQEGTPLLVAIGAVGRVQEIEIQPPASSEDLQSLQASVEAIARASQCRFRRVQLVDNWWQQEYGPLLGSTLENNVPVALLPNQGKGSRYLLFNPVEQTRTPLSPTVAQTVAPTAYMFYRPLPSVIRSAVELFWFGIQGYHQDFVFIGLMGVIASVLAMIAPLATGMLIDKAIPNGDRSQLLQIGLALLAAAFGQSAFRLSQGIITLRIEKIADGNLQLSVWDRLLKLTPAFFRHYSSGDLVSRLLAIRQIRSQLSGATLRTLLSSVFSLLNIGLMFFYNVKLALVGLGISILAVIVTVTSGVLLVRQERHQEKLQGEIDGLTVQLLNGVAKLRVAAAEERAFGAWAKKYTQKTKLVHNIKRIDDNVSTFNETLPLLGSALLFWFTILFIQTTQARGSSEGLTAGTFIAFNAAFGIFIGGITDLSNTLTDILGIVPLWERAKVIVQSQPESNSNQVNPGRIKGDVKLERISFRYREDGPLILDDVSIQAKPGEFIALVGPSGSGKSTLLRLLLGFETPIGGTVYYDNQDLARLDVTAVRRQLGVVLQNGRVQQSSIFDNIAGGALVTLSEATEAARMAGLAEDIEQMPMGMHTVVNEGGSNLSGGQRQRLLIARALVNKPKIVLMDEATSALDNRTQALVTESLEKLKTTRIVIAHRISTIRYADRIYVLDAGRIVQVGSFAELLAQEGLFARLVARQLE